MAEERLRIPVRELDKFSMFANSPTGGRKPRLAWCERSGNPRITVYTNAPEDTTNFGMINAPMNPETFFIFLSYLKKIAEGPNNVKMKVDCDTAEYGEDNKVAGRTLLSEVFFGKDERGIVWISLIAVSRPKIKFEFQISDYHRIVKGDGTPLSESETSALQAAAVSDALGDIYGLIASEYRIKPNQPNASAGPKRMPPSPPSSLTFDDDVL